MIPIYSEPNASCIGRLWLELLSFVKILFWKWIKWHSRLGKNLENLMVADQEPKTKHFKGFFQDSVFFYDNTIHHVAFLPQNDSFKIICTFHWSWNREKCTPAIDIACSASLVLDYSTSVTLTAPSRTLHSLISSQEVVKMIWNYFKKVEKLRGDAFRKDIVKRASLHDSLPLSLYCKTKESHIWSTTHQRFHLLPSTGWHFESGSEELRGVKASRP